VTVLFVYPNEILPERGGVQRVTSVLADYFEANGVDVFYLSFNRTSCEGTVSHRQYYFPNNEVTCEGNTSFFIDFLKLNDIEIVINQAGIDPHVSRLVYVAKNINVKIISVINNSIMSGIKNFSSLYKRRAKRYRMEFLLPISDISFVNFWLRYLYKTRYQKHYKELCLMSDKVIILSDSFREELAFMVGDICKNSVLTIPNPLAFSPESINLKDKKHELLFVGRVDCVFKQVDVLLKIWSFLHERFPDWELKIVGGDGEGEITSLSKNLGLKNVSFEGFQDPTPYYSNASIFCLTSSSESFGLVLIEAMRFGVVPFAFSSYDSVTDIIDSPKVGVLIEPFDCKQYSDELSKLMLDRRRREEMAIMAQQKSCLYSIDVIGDKWLNLFKNLERV